MKWIIVTGVSGKLGYEIADLYIRKSDSGVIGLCRTISSNVNRLIKNYPEHFKYLSFDLSYPERIKNLYLTKIKQIGRLHGIVNNSANAYSDLVTNVQFDHLIQMYEINVFSPILLTKYVIRDLLLHNSKGSIVHITSVSAHTGYKGLAMYASTKGALESFSKNTAREWGKKGIRSNCVAPGFMETDMTSSLDEQEKERIYRRTSLGSSTDIISVAETVNFLLSDRSSSITGEVIHVDSGTI